MATCHLGHFIDVDFHLHGRKSENADFQKNPFATGLELLEFNLPGESTVLSGSQHSLSSVRVKLLCVLPGRRGHHR